MDNLSSFFFKCKTSTRIYCFYVKTQYLNNETKRTLFQVANLSIAIWDMVKDRGARHAAVHGDSRVAQDLANEQQQFINLDSKCSSL